MLKEITMYYVNCDGCQKIYDSTGDGFFMQPCEAAEDITENGWAIDGEKCYCPDCIKKSNEL